MTTNGLKQQRFVPPTHRMSLIGLTIAAFLQTGCEQLLDVETNPEVVDAGKQVTLNETMIGAAVDLYRAVDEAISHGGLFGDEFVSAAPGPSHRAMDARQVTAAVQQGAGGDGRGQGLGGGFYIPLQRLVAVSRMGQDRILDGAFEELANPSPDVAEYARLAFYEGLAKLYLADLYCTVAFYGTGPEHSPEEAYRQAEGHFTDAIDAVNAEPAVRSAAHVLRARARLILGDDAGARADANEVDPDFEYSVTYSSAIFEQRNRIQVHTIDVRDWSVAPRFRGLTIDDSGVIDPRTRLEGPFPAFDATQLGYGPTKYASPSAPIRIASGDEARYIVAEIEGGSTAVDIINEVRARHGVTPSWTPQSGSVTEIRDKLIDERARTLFAEGAHLGDLRRYLEKYGLDLFPTSTPQGIPMGTQTCMPMPAIERDNNPGL